MNQYNCHFRLFDSQKYNERVKQKYVIIKLFGRID